MMIMIHNKWLDGPCCLQDQPVLHNISALPYLGNQRALCAVSDNPECQLKQLLDSGLAVPFFPWTAATAAMSQGAGGFVRSQMY